MEMVPRGTLSASSFQPGERPTFAAIAAVREAMEQQAGSKAAERLQKLVAGRSHLAGLSREARELAMFTADVAARGIEVPLDVRQLAATVPAGTPGRVYELLSGHRRLVAADLAELNEVPIQDRGALANHAAALAVLRANAHRSDFAPWHKALARTQLQRRQQEAGEPASVRDLGR